MGQPTITFNRGTSGLGRPLPGKDHYSGMVFYSGTLPSGFSSSNRIQRVFSLLEAEALGITNNHIGETASTGTVTITAVGSNGDTIDISVAEYGGSVDLGTYTKVSGDTTVTAVALALKNIINAGTTTHGYTAANSSGVLTITARPGLGVYLNSGTPLSTTIVGGITATLVQFSSGVASLIDQIHYHVSEFFRIQPKGVLDIGIFDVPGGSYDFAEAKTLIEFNSGEIRNLGVYVTSTTLATSLVTALNTALMTEAGLDSPVSAILVADFKATALSALPDLTTLSDYRVSVAIGQDAGGVGYTLYLALGKTVGTMGATLGAVALASVNESIAWVQKFDVSDGNELEVVGFGNGVLFKNQAQSLLDTLNDYHYLFIKKFKNKDGSYHNDSTTAIVNSNDFSTIENTRTVDKSIRGILSSTLDQLNSPIDLNADGTLFEDTIAEFERLVAIPLDDMQRNGEISAYKTTIDPRQDVLTTSKITISVAIVPTGVARQIVFNVGLTKSV